jgi:hypothetical protein
MDEKLSTNEDKSYNALWYMNFGEHDFVRARETQKINITYS